MTFYSVQFIQHSVSGLPEDDFVNTLHYATPEPVDSGDALALAGAVSAAFFDARAGVGPYLQDYIGPGVSRVNLPHIKVYDAEAPGSPLAVAQAAGMRAAVGTTQLPQEAAICLSFRGNNLGALEVAQDDADPDAAPERPRSRFRGRIYIGPLGNNVLSGTAGRPHANFATAALDLAQRLAAAPAAIDPNMQWVVASRADASQLLGSAVVHAGVDNAYDTQRRRGAAPTSRDTATIVPN
jgi:hypothetical protein